MSRAVRGRLGRLLGLASLAVLGACGETGVSAPLPVGSIQATGGARTAVAGSALSDPVEVRVLGSDNQPLANVTVTFTVSAGGGSVDPATATTDNTGLARTRWTLGRTAGANTLTVTAGASTSTITATGTAGRAATVAAAAGDGQVAPAGSAVATAPGVRVTDANNNPVAGVTVTFAVASGGGRVTDAVRTTNANGLAAVGSWVLGGTAGTQTLSARVEEPGVANNPIVFSAVGTAGPAAQATAVSATTQTGTVGTAVAAPPAVRVADANGNPVAGVQVSFSVTAGGGTLTGNIATTNAQGVATVGGWTLGPTAGANQVTAVIPNAANVVFNATGTAGAATAVVILQGNNQRAQINRAVAVAPAVAVRDAFGNGVSGVVVTFAVASGGGSVVSGRQVTDATGTAQVGAWFLGEAPGANTLTATAPGLAAVTFTATADPGRPVSMVANSAVTQSAVAGTAVPEAPSVIVRDLGGNPVPGVSVTFAVTAGGGVVAGSPVVTNAQGVATLTSWTLGATAGANTVVASATGLPSVTFNATGTAGAAANIVATAGNNQAAVQGTAVAVAPAVRVTDANNNPVSGVTVTFAVTNGGGSVSGATQTTDANGVATVGGWTLGTGAPNTLTATATGTGITGNPVTFTAQSATQIVGATVPAGPLTLGANFNLSVRLQNSGNANVSLAGVQVTIAIASGGGTLNGTLTATTNADGIATFTNINVTGTAGARTFTISGTGLTALTTPAITFN